ncbi:hypothetical protein ATANTOWER_004818 [Ataeniobius toweri]|uniref:Uncharacterized protein n=1 Tax=Ataeniobius toweri TaxID=208326 RepID=A0ABU7C5N1_9TELE|nr:hypothetical protein [Ataeniobius toweri]
MRPGQDRTSQLMQTQEVSCSWRICRGLSCIGSDGWMKPRCCSAEQTEPVADEELLRENPKQAFNQQQMVLFRNLYFYRTTGPLSAVVTWQQKTSVARSLRDTWTEDVKTRFMRRGAELQSNLDGPQENIWIRSVFG